MQKSLADLKAVRTPEELAALLGISYKKHLIYHLYRVPEEYRYTELRIPKRRGGERIIHAPSTKLKLIQKSLSKELQKIYRAPRGASGFVLQRGIHYNARPHVGHKYILNIDLKDFFTSINFGRVRGLLMAKPYELPERVATVVAQICCFKGILPQGAPTSPVISNMICTKLDHQLFEFARDNGCFYSRYADDISFSTVRSSFPRPIANFSSEPSRALRLGTELLQIIESNGFSINETKTRLLTPRDRLEVTGLVLNKRINVRRSYIREVRAMLNDWKKIGEEPAAKKHHKSTASKHRLELKESPPFEWIVRGKLEFIKFTRGSNDRLVRSLVEKFNTLSKRKIELPSSALESTLQANVWILETDLETVPADKPASDCFQGTAFWLDGVGLLTCQHVLSSSMIIFRPSELSKRIPVVCVWQDENLDVALLRPSSDDFAPAPSRLKSSPHRHPDLADPIQVVGFPKFESGDSITIRSGQVVSYRTKSGVKRFVVSADIVAGNSGGPVIDENMRVVGMAVTGDDGSTSSKEHAHCATPISYILDAVPLEFRF